jgi:glucosamine kinase
MAHVLGIDAGGTRMRARLMSDALAVAEAEESGGNILTVGDLVMRERLSRVLRQLGSTDIQAVCIGAAGSGSPDAQGRLHRLVSELLPTARVLVVHDARLVLAAGGLSSGIALISGTGSSAFGRTASGDEATAGGWGYMLGDEGSGYWITRMAVRHVLTAHNERRPPGPLTESMVRAFGAHSLEDLLPRVYAGGGPAALAQHAPRVFAAAEEGDEAAQSIIREATMWLWQLVASVIEQIHIVSPIVLAGGVLLHHHLLQSRLREELARHLPASDVVCLKGSAAEGAVYLAQRLLTA